MRKILDLFLIFVIVRVSVKDSNATTVDRLVWTAGSAVNVTFGPEDAVYCRLKDNKGTTVYDGFGPCRVVLDRVTREHRGSWELFVGAPGTVIVRSSWVDVDVIAAGDSAPAVTTSAVNNQSTVILTCSLPEEYQVQSCTFREPSGTVFIASPGVGQDKSEDQTARYESYAEDNICNLTLVWPPFDRYGIWRCAVNTTRGSSYGFHAVTEKMPDPGYTNSRVLPVLKVPDIFKGTEGDAFTMSCYIGAPVRYCYFRSPNGTVFNVGPSTSSADYEYVGNGFDAGECGIRFNNIWKSATGDRWSCNVGLSNTSYFEKTAFFDVYIYERLSVYSLWEGSALVVQISTGSLESEVEYCRVVRSDGLGFVSKQAPFPYDLDVNRYGLCTLFIPRPVAEDLRPWTVVVKLYREDEERSVTTSLVPPPQSTRGLSRTASTLLWSFFGTIFVFLILVSFLPKKNREWTHQRAVRIRNSFRRQPQPQPQNVAVLPNPVHTDILTDLPRKV